MKKIAFILFTLWMTGRVLADDGIWLTSFSEAADQAARENKLVLLDFTGSDWCGWCMKLDEETFSRAEFIQYATNNVVLERVDFPMHKSLPSDVKTGNRALKRKYDVAGFPTVLIVKPDGSILWDQRGYAPGGPGVMIDAITQCRRAAGLTAWKKPAPVPAAPAKPAAVAAAPVQHPAPPPQKPADEPKVGGILYSASHSSVLLDGKYCEVGDTVRGRRVLKIARDKVTVEFQGQIEILTY